jgi:ABC-2 type transport system permease protein
MLSRVKTLVMKELLGLWRDRQTRIILLISPVLQLLLFSFAATQDVRNINIAVLNEDWGSESKELVARFAGSPIFTNIRYIRSAREIASVIDAQAVTAVLQFDAQFSRSIKAGHPADVQIILDGRRSNAAQIVVAYALEIIDRYNLDGALILDPGPRSVALARVWFNPNLAPLWSSVPGLFALLTTTVAMMVSSLTVARERELGTFDQLLVSPLSGAEILLGKVTCALLVTLSSSSMMLVVSAFLLSVPFDGSIAALYVALVIFLTSIIGVGIFISSLATTQQQAVVGTFVFMAPAYLLSGFATPVQNMPDWLQWLAAADPVRHFVLLCKGLFLKDLPFSVVLQHVWPMAIIAALTMSAGAWLFRHQDH